MPKPPPAILTVRAARRLTPNMIRVTLAGPRVEALDPSCAGANCKLFLPDPGQSRQAFEAQLISGPRPTVRTYTVRHVRSEVAEMDIDFVDHGEGGPASRWARSAVAGDVLGFAGPGPVKLGSFYADEYLVVADMSALPLAGATLEAMPEDARGTAIFEIMDPADQQSFRIPKGITCHWLVNPDPHVRSERIAQMVAGLDFGARRVQTCIAGESGMIKQIRQDLLVRRALDKADCYISGYWKIGLVEDEHQAMKRAEAMV